MIFECIPSPTEKKLVGWKLTINKKCRSRIENLSTLILGEKMEIWEYFWNFVGEEKLRKIRWTKNSNFFLHDNNYLNHPPAQKKIGQNPSTAKNKFLWNHQLAHKKWPLGLDLEGRKNGYAIWLMDTEWGHIGRGGQEMLGFNNPYSPKKRPLVLKCTSRIRELSRLISGGIQREEGVSERLWLSKRKNVHP